MVSVEEVISIIEICIYIPILFCTAIVLFRHGIRRQSGWIYLAIFCGLRIAGGIFRIKSVRSPDNSTDLEWAVILQSVGLSPLLGASLGLLKRFVDEVSTHVRSGNDFPMSGGIIGKIYAKRATATSRRSRIIQLAALPLIIALALCIIGGTDDFSSNPSDQSKGPKYTKIGVCMFLAIYLLLTLLLIITMKDVGKAPSGEKRIFFAVLVAIPPLGVRVLWSMLSSFSHNPDFSIVHPKPWINLAMAVAEELFIVVMYTAVGLTVAY